MMASKRHRSAVNSQWPGHLPATGRLCLLVGMAGTFSLEKLPRLAPEGCRPMEVRPPTVVPGSTPSTHRYLTTLCICQHSAHQCSQQFSVPAKNRNIPLDDFGQLTNRPCCSLPRYLKTPPGNKRQPPPVWIRKRRTRLRRPSTSTSATTTR